MQDLLQTQFVLARIRFFQITFKDLGVLFEVALEGVTTQQLVHSRVSQRAHLTCFLCQGILPLNLPPFFDSLVCVRLCHLQATTGCPEVLGGLFLSQYDYYKSILSYIQ